MTVIEGSPEALRASARVLGARSADLHARAGSVAGAAGVATRGWQGTASVRFLARAGEASRTLRTTATHLSDVAGATARYASELEAAQQRAGAFSLQQQHAARDVAGARARLADPPAIAEPGDGGRARAEHLALTRAEARLRGLGSELEDLVAAHRASARRFVGCLESFDPSCSVPHWMSDTWVLGTAAKDMAKAVQKSWLVASFGRHTRAAFTALRAGDLQTYLHRAEQAADKVVELAHGKTGAWVRRLPAVARRVIVMGQKRTPFGIVLMGATDVVTGGGYSGWRGGTTRVLGGAAAIAQLSLMTGVAVNPIGGPAAGVTIAAYLSWKAGNFVYDHRRQLLRIAKQAGRAVVRGGRLVVDAHVRAFHVARWTATHPLQAVKRGFATVDAAIRSGATRVADRVGRGLRHQVASAGRGVDYLRKHFGVPDLRPGGPFTLKERVARSLADRLREVWTNPCRLRTLTVVPLPRCRAVHDSRPMSGSFSW